MGYEKYSVLIIEDDRTYRKLMRRIIEERIGARCMEASNPIEAFHLFAEGLPDLIVMDLLLPEMNGVTAVERLRSLEVTKNIPIAVCSSVTERHLIMQLAKLGIKDFLLKPLQSALVVDKIKELLPKVVEDTPAAQEKPAQSDSKNVEEDIWV